VLPLGWLVEVSSWNGGTVVVALIEPPGAAA
jgi:hypothetical protein